MPRPICVHCGQPYGQRATTTEQIKFAVGEPKPTYRGNGIIVKETVWATGGSTGHTEHLTFTVNETIITRTIWDGESYWRSYDPFCKLRCALDYARKAYARSQQPALRRVR